MTKRRKGDGNMLPAKIYLQPEDESIVFEADDLYLKIVVASRIKEISNVKYYLDGTFSFHCCFGEEWLDIITIAKELELEIQPGKYFLEESA
jgi:hypothetical protein